MTIFTPERTVSYGWAQPIQGDSNDDHADIESLLCALVTRVIPSLLGPGFQEGNFSMDQGEKGWLRDDLRAYIYYALNFYSYYISPTSDRKALDPRVWRPLFWFTHLAHITNVTSAP